MTDISIIFENENLVAINKPSGLSVHGDGVKEEKTVADWLVAHYPDSAGVGEERLGRNGAVIERSGIVHRLDKDTSGVMVLAKTQEMFEHLKQQFQDREVKKEYRAFVYGRMREQWGTIDRPIGRNSRDFRLRSAQRGAKGTMRDSITDWEVITSGQYDSETFSYMKLLPRTGRMHQLRVHLKAVDRPIVADPLYAGKRAQESNNLGLDRLALHAYSLDLELMDGERHTFVAEIPNEFEKSLKLFT